ncbi:MAG: ribose-phosphate pyrophosphokinase [Cytophagales bacterium]|nr:ribose-phosphate pyrophosphokinase [Armatimonadota bacterium]
MSIFSGTAHPELSREIVRHLGVELGDLKITRFADSEIYVKFEQSVRGTEAFIIQPTCQPIDSNLLELLILLDALKRASADMITVVLPYYGYARQEKKDAPREPITAKLIANLLTTAGAQRIVAMDLHADAIQGFFDIPVDHLTALPIIADYLAEKHYEDVVVVSPDEGRVKKVRKIASRLRAPLAVGYKVHPEHGVSEITGLAGDVRGKTCIVYDDMISTGGSINEIVDALLRNGARPEITVACTHAVLAGPAVERLSRPEIKELILTDTIPVPPEKRSAKTTVLSTAPLFAQAIRRIWTDESVSELFTD